MNTDKSGFIRIIHGSNVLYKFLDIRNSDLSFIIDCP